MIPVFLQPDSILFIFKILLLILMFVFILFSVIIVTRINAFNRTIYLAASHASIGLQVLSILILLAAISLFILTLVIV